MTKKFEILVQKAPEFISLLPWSSEFEKAVFLKPDSTSLEVISFATVTQMSFLVGKLIIVTVRVVVLPLFSISVDLLGNVVTHFYSLVIFQTMMI